MYVTYRPEGGDEQSWEFDPDRVRASAAELVEKRYGESWAMFLAGVQQGSIRARRVLLWHLIRRDHHTLKYEDTPDFYAGEVEVQYDAAELLAMRDAVMKAEVPDKEREQVLTALDMEITDAMAREGAATDDGEPEPVGKAPSKKSGNATGSP